MMPYYFVTPENDNILCLLVIGSVTINHVSIQITSILDNACLMMMNVEFDARFFV